MADPSRHPGRIPDARRIRPSRHPPLAVFSGDTGIGERSTPLIARLSVGILACGARDRPASPKEGLREAVDRRAIALVNALVTELAGASGEGPSASLAAALSSELERDPLLPAYLRRLLIDGGTPAETLFRSLFEAVLSGFANLEAAGLVRPSSDPEVRTAFLLVNDLAVVLLRDQVHEVIGIDPLARSGMERWTAQVLDVYSRGVLTIGGVSTTQTDPPRGAA